jgi:ABC-type proline/glycine betaine transport system substrate-binding protein
MGVISRLDATPNEHPIQMHNVAGGDEFFGPDYGAATVYTLVRNGSAEQCSNVTRRLNDLPFSLQMARYLTEPFSTKTATPVARPTPGETPIRKHASPGSRAVAD